MKRLSCHIEDGMRSAWLYSRRVEPVFLLLLIALGINARGQEAGLTEQIKHEISGLRGTDLWTEHRQEVEQLWDSMPKSVAALEEYSGKPVPREYKESLSHQADALHLVYNRELPAKHRIDICKAVDKDLSIKARHAQDNPSAPFTSIVVLVYSKQGGQITHGCQIWFVCEAWRGTKARHERFPKESSPSEKPMPPGYYFMWTEKSGATGTQTPVTVDSKSKKQPVDLPCP